MSINHNVISGWISALAGKFRRLLRFQPFRYFQVSQETWNAQYKGGKWEYLRSAGQTAHYAVIAAYFSQYAKNGRVLDVGCGEGILRDHLIGYGYSEYVGIDYADAAIEKARQTEDARTAFTVAGVDAFEPDGKFDAIIFNEVLYYLKNPADSVVQYARYLSGNGVIIVSMWKSPGTRRIWKMLESQFETLQAIELRPVDALPRVIQVLQPQSGQE